MALLLATGVSSDTKLSERQRAEHVLNRLAFGARPGDVERILDSGGVDAWIDGQLHPETIQDTAVEAHLCKLPTLQLTNADIVTEYYKPIQIARREKKAGEPIDTDAMKVLRQKSQEVVRDLVGQRIIRATESNRQLNEVMTDFWFNHFNVFAGKGIDRFLLTSYERDTIRPHIWGSFEDLLMATAKSPAMLFYLDNAQSVTDPEHRNPRMQAMLERRNPQVAKKRGLNENYAREIMELHTLGVDGGYTQKDVTELARVFTGWSIDQRTGTFLFRPAMHDVGAKTVLGVYFPPGGGIEEGERMIHILAHHPATAHHIALQLCQRLVSDNPPKALVDRVAKKFLDSNGDLRATVRTVIDSPEFWDRKVYAGKEKSPFEFVISAIRAVDGEVLNPMPVANALRQIGEPLYGAQPPTGYSEKSEVWNNSGALMNRINFVVALANNQLPGVRVLVSDPKQTAVKLGSPEFQQQ
ncbi:MAG TPA: DUF1800 domain-containing protein [Thermoanaerobaculia bacterium]|nr:DUF1800 domain-containing protein [Thermoanaerobaculia bacterium]